MSGQAARSRVRAQARWREQVARFIVANAEVGVDGQAVGDCGANCSDCLAGVMEALRDGDPWHFDVAAARSAAEATLARAEADLVELEMFKDWTRERGRGPESNEPGAHGCTIGVWSIGVVPQMPGEIEMNIDGERATVFTNGTEPPAEVEAMLAKACGGVSEHRVGVIVRAHRVRAHGVVPVTVARVDEEPLPGGWPGRLARKYARKRCPNKCEPARVLDDVTPGGSTTLPDGSVSRSYTATPGRWTWLANGIECTTCDRGWVQHGDRRAEILTAPARARVARRVLDALEGQPSECQSCEWSVCEGRARAGHGWVHARGHDDRDVMARTTSMWMPFKRCPACRGTGLNLRGALPPIPWSKMTALRRRCLEHETHDLHTPVDRQRDGHQSWVRELADETRIEAGPLEMITLGSAWLTKVDPETGASVHTPETRVVSRGQHRHNGEWPRALLTHSGATRGTHEREAALDLLISERLWDVWGDDWHEVPLCPASRPLRQGEHGPRDRWPQGPRRRVRKEPEPRWRRAADEEELAVRLGVPLAVLRGIQPIEYRGPRQPTTAVVTLTDGDGEVQRLEVAVDEDGRVQMPDGWRDMDRVSVGSGP